MSRPSIRVFASGSSLLILLLFLGLSACGRGEPEREPPAWRGTPAEQLAVVDGCARDRASLLRLDGDPLACADASDCPGGAHCEDGACAWECAADSDCGTGKSCSCDGVCSDSPPREARSLHGSTDCAPDVELLQSLQTPAGQVACSYDDDCPVGASCDPLAGACAWECLPPGEATAQCPSGRVCDCTGACVLPGAVDPSGEVDPLRKRARLAASPGLLELGRAGDPASVSKLGRIDVKLVAGSLEIANASTAAIVRVSAGPETEVSCDPDAPQNGQGFGPTCTLGAWTFVSQGDTRQASAVVWTRLTATTASSRDRWQVVVASPDTLNRRRIVPIHLPGGLAPDGVTLFEGEYAGTVTLKDSGARDDDKLDGPNLVADPGFEGQWSRTLGWPWFTEGVTATGVDRRAEGFPYARTGDNNAFIWIATGWSSIQQTIHVTPDTDYRLAFYLEAGVGLRDGWFGVRDTANNQFAARKFEAIAGYTEHWIDFNSGPRSQVNVFVGMWGPGAGEWFHLEDVSVRRRLPAPEGAGRLTLPVKAVARGQDVIILDPTRQLSPSGRIHLPWAQDHAYHETWIAPGAATNDPMPDTGSLAAHIVQRGADLQLTPGRLRGRFTVELPTQPAPTSLVYELELARSGDLARPDCSQSCAAPSTCDQRIGLCLPGAPFQAPTQTGNTIAHTPAVRWRDAARSLFASSSGLYGSYSSSMKLGYTVADATRVDGRFAKADMLGIERALPTTGHQYCSYYGGFAAKFMYQGLRPGTKKLANGCWPADDGMSKGDWGPPASNSQYCDKVYFGRRYLNLTFPPTGQCLKLNPSAEQTEQLKRDYIPCVVDPTGQRVRGTQDFSCNTLWEQAIQDRWRDWNVFIGSECVKTEENVFEGFGGGPERELELYLCPYRESLHGISGDAVGERYACYDAGDPGPSPGNGTPVNPFLSAHFSAQVLPVSGDMACTRGHKPMAVELYSTGDVQATWSAGARTKVADMLTACLADLDRTPPSLGAVNLSNAVSTFQGFFQRTACINYARFMPAVYERDAYPRSYFMRQLQQWLGVHAFVARMGLGQWRDESIVAGTGTSPHRDLANLEVLLARLEKGWDFVLDANVGGRIAEVNIYHAAEDYRLWWNWNGVVFPKKEHEQAVHLQVSMLESLSAYLDVLDAYVDQAALETYGSCLGEPGASSRTDALVRLGASLRYVTAIEAMARRMNERTAGWADVANETRWRTAHKELALARTRVATKAAALDACQNPLGISDGEVFLYFDDPVGEKARFFASSDYLFGKARPAVDEAMSRLSAARDAWISARSSVVQGQRDQNERDRLLVDVKVSYGKPIQKACGLTLDAKDVIAAFHPISGTLAPETCYVRREDPRCQVNPVPDSCLRGELGAAVLIVRQAEKETEIARSQMSDHIARYQTQFRYCQNLKLEVKQDLVLSAAHTAEMESLHRLKQNAEADANLFSFVKGLIESVATFGATAPSAMGTAIANDKIISYQYQMEVAEGRHREVMAARAAHREVAKCFLEADTIKIGIDTASKQIYSRLLAVSSAMIQFQNLLTQVQQFAVEGPAALERELGRTVASITHHYFAGEKAAEFEAQFALARWFTLLSVLAVEHDFHQSLGVRGLVVGATNPAELSKALDILDLTRTPRQLLPNPPELGGPQQAGRPPDEDNIVFSLRDDLLVLYDRTSVVAGGDPDAPAPNHATALERFQARLWDPQYAVYGNQGEYLGQGIPFRVPVGGELADRCAERLWRVNATVQGDLTQVRVPLQLLQRNSFASQVCHRGSDDPQFQEGHVGTTAQAYGLTPASINAWLNVTRSDFYRDAYADGSSNVLAGRGLYGEYILLFPWNGLLASGFALDQVEDVLIRFDYLSVNNLLWDGQP